MYRFSDDVFLSRDEITHALHVGSARAARVAEQDPCGSHRRSPLHRCRIAPPPPPPPKSVTEQRIERVRETPGPSPLLRPHRRYRVNVAVNRRAVAATPAGTPFTVLCSPSRSVARPLSTDHDDVARGRSHSVRVRVCVVYPPTSDDDVSRQ